jgi:hypothetical protein
VVRYRIAMEESRSASASFFTRIMSFHRFEFASVWRTAHGAVSREAVRVLELPMGRNESMGPNRLVWASPSGLALHFFSRQICTWPNGSEKTWFTTSHSGRNATTGLTGISRGSYSSLNAAPICRAAQGRD